MDMACIQQITDQIALKFYQRHQNVKKRRKKKKQSIGLIDALTKYNIQPPHLWCFIEIVNEEEKYMQKANQWMQGGTRKYYINS
jgi:predicted nuclease of restriction endonuclease-like (RecB) superfamily